MTSSDGNVGVHTSVVGAMRPAALRASSGSDVGRLRTWTSLRHVSLMPGATHVATLSNGQKLQVSRLQSRILRRRFLKL